MPSTIVSPNDSRPFDGRRQGYVVRVHKTNWKHPVRFIAKDYRGLIIAEGTVQSSVPYREFLVHQSVGFRIINVGEWDMEVTWPQAQVAFEVTSDTELDQVISDLPWEDGFDLGAGVDAITGGTAGRAVTAFTPKEHTVKKAVERYRFIQDESELNSEIEVSTSGKYNIQGVEVSDSMQYLKSIQYSELCITLIAEYETSSTEYDEAENYSFTDAAKALIGEPDKFRKAYGDYFISGGKRTSRFLAVYRCQATTVRSMDEFKASFGGDMPKVFSAEGSAHFLQSASQHGIETSLDLYTDGYKGTSPSGPWTPQKILEALEWFKENEQGVYLRAKLKHYSTIDPKFPRTIGVSPSVFVELRLLYTKIWDIRTRYASLPQYYQDQMKPQYQELVYGVEASQMLLATDATKRQQCLQSADVLLRALDDVFARMDFYFKVKNVVSTEPAIDYHIEESDGPQIWMYGFSVYNKSNAVVIHKSQLTYDESYHIGWREKTLEFGPDDRYLIVGWKVISNWGDGTNGSWWKAVDQILLKSHGAVHVKSQYDRGCDWTVVYYYVEVKDYQF